MKKEELRYLQRLAELYPTIAKASTEIINLQSILNLPKGTEHFMSDIHGEYDAFSHVLRNGSGAVRKKIDDVFGHTLSNSDKRSLATLIYYPKEKMEVVKKQEEDMENWYKITLYRLIEVCKTTASKYTRSKVRKALPADYAYVIEELITEKAEVLDKEAYYDAIVNTIIEIGRAENFIIALAELIQRLVVDHLHVLGDIYDRGPGPHFIMDRLMKYHSLDIQWGNHDVVWMGAATGQKACIATVIRNSIRYRNMDILEDGYGINLMPLATFAMEAYKDDPCTAFEMKGDANNYSILEEELGRKMHKAIAIIQFKLEGQLIRRHKEFHMENRCLLHRIDPKKGTITLPNGKEYPLTDTAFPTIDWKKPYELTTEEKDVMERLDSAFRNCEKLQNHVRLLLDKGGLYKTYNGNLLFHGSIPLNEDGSLKEVQIYGKTYKGKELYDVLETYVRRAFFSVNEDEKRKGRDIMWYIWAAPNSPLFGKDKMTTFERYFVKDKETHKETKNAYYHLLENEEIVDDLLREFRLDPEKGHIINGHVPVHQSEGESPVKCNGKVLVIDGGFSRPYQKVTGIAGYTLVYNSYGLILSAHEPFTSAEEAVAKEQDIVSNRVAVHYNNKRTLVGDTDTGTALKERISELIQLLEAYRKGIIKEKKISRIEKYKKSFLYATVNRGDADEKKQKRKKQLRAVLILLIILFILAGLGGMLYVSHRDKVEKEQRREAALAALDSIPEVTATPVATATPVPTATPTPSLTPVPTILPAFEPENYQGIWYSEDGLTTINIYDISLKSISFTYKRVNGKDPSMTAEADVTAEVAGNATQFRFKDSEGNKAKGEFVFDKSGELYVKVKTYERGDGSLTYPKTESIMTRQEPSLEVSENSEEDASYNESNESSYERESYSESSEDSSDKNTEEYEIPYGEEETYYTE